jgi:RNA polymerase sigma-70 factor (ECF subfamily)
MTGDMHRAEDLKQDAFSRLFERRHDFRQGGRLSTWLWRIAVNLCHDDLRRVRRRGESPLDGEDETGETGLTRAIAFDDPPDAAFASREEGELVRRALLQLPEEYRAVLVLRHYEGLKLREIAEVLDVPEGTVNSRMAEALARMTRLLTPQFEPARRTVRMNPNLNRNELQVL